MKYLNDSNMKKVFFLYTCDIWHSHQSKDLIAVCDSKENLLELCKRECKRSGVKNFNAEAKQFFTEKLQTQHNLDDGNNLFEFIAEEYTLNELIQ